MAETTPSTTPTPSEPGKPCCGRRTKLVVALAVLLALAAGVFWYLGANSEVNLFKFGGKGGVKELQQKNDQRFMGEESDTFMGTDSDL